jgi:hypothetical protein
MRYDDAGSPSASLPILATLVLAGTCGAACAAAPTTGAVSVTAPSAPAAPSDAVAGPSYLPAPIVSLATGPRFADGAPGLNDLRSGPLYEATVLAPYQLAAVLAAGLEPLGPGALPPGTREARIWLSSGPTIPQHMVRLSVRGDSVEGAVIRRFPPLEELSLETALEERLRAELRARCGPFQRVERVVTCRALMPDSADWHRFETRAAELGLWTLPDPHDVGWRGRVIQLDGSGVTVEVQDGPRYRLYGYQSKDYRRRPYGVAAAELYRHVWTIIPPAFAPRPDG